MKRIIIREGQLNLIDELEPRIKGVIFDFDYTLFNTDEVQDARSIAKHTKGTQKEKNAAWVEASKSANKCIPYNGIKELVSYLYKNNIACGIVTFCNALFVESALSAAGLPNMRIYSAHRVFRPKSKCMLKFVSELGIKPNECLSIGDRASDGAESQKANIPFIGCSWGNGLDDDRISNGIKSPLDVITYIEKGSAY
jgi:phosphoglycolate phosphatase-like HAD superfamily hydrolase